MALPDGDIRVPELLLWHEGPLSAYYAPWDWVNVDARVMLVGITAGLHQAIEATREAQRCLRESLSNEEALRRADAIGSFSGPMRTILVDMLDGIGLQDALGIDSTSQLFGSHHHLAAGDDVQSTPGVSLVEDRLPTVVGTPSHRLGQLVDALGRQFGE